MNSVISNKKDQKKRPGVLVDENMKTHENDPYFIKKAEEAAAFIKKVGLPPQIKKHRSSANL